jgi:integrase
MIEMGRPKTVNLDLPPRMSARKLKSGRILYYYQAGGKKIPLSDNINIARIEWAKYENGGVTDSPLFRFVANRWKTEAINLSTKRGKKHRSDKTQAEYRGTLEAKDSKDGPLMKGFGHIPMDDIKPVHVRNYLDRRSAKVLANREVAVLSVIFNWAREKGLTSAANPCDGVRRNPETPRDVYVQDEAFEAVYGHAVEEMKDMMDLAEITSQRPGDVLRMTRTLMRDGCLWVKQAKTSAFLGIKIEGDLKVVLDRIFARPRKVQSVYLFAREDGQRFTYWQMYGRFKKARKAAGATWQLRDLRAKSVTDEDDLRKASQRAGHANEHITATVYRRIRGNVVSPLNRKRLEPDLEPSKAEGESK